MRRSTAARYFSGTERPNRTIIGMPTPTVIPSPRKLDTRTSLDGIFITVKELSAVPTLPSVAGPFTVIVYFSPQLKALAGVQVPALVSTLPPTSLPSASFTATVVLAGSSLSNLTGARASTPVASALGEVTETVLSGGA